MYIRWLGRLIDNIPGYRTFGHYRILPLFFLVGAGIEFAMIKWSPNGVNFYKTFKKNQVDSEARSQLHHEELRDRVLKDLAEKHKKAEARN